MPSRLGDLTRCLFGVVGSTLNHNVGKLDRAKLEGLNGQLSQMWSDRRQSLPHSNPYHSNRSLDQPVQTNLCELIDSVPPKSAKGKFEFFKLTPKAKHEKSKSISIPSNASSDSDQKKSEKPKRRRSRHDKKSNESHVSSIFNVIYHLKVTIPGRIFKKTILKSYSKVNDSRFSESFLHQRHIQALLRVSLENLV